MVLTVDSNVDNSITGLKIGSATVNSSNYSIDGLELTIKKEYLATLAEGEKVFTILMEIANDVSVVVTVVDTTDR